MKNVLNFLASALALSCCGLEREPVSIDGRIDSQTLEYVRSLPNTPLEIHITSQGGDTPTAIEIAKIIRERGYGLVVKKYCLSACAQWLLPEARKVRLIDMPIVGFHHSGTAFHEILVASGDLKEAELY